MDNIVLVLVSQVQLENSGYVEYIMSSVGQIFSPLIHKTFNVVLCIFHPGPWAFQTIAVNVSFNFEGMIQGIKGAKEGAPCWARTV